MSYDIVIDKAQTKKMVSAVLRFLNDPVDVCTSMTKFEYTFKTRPAENADLFSKVFAESVFCSLSGDCSLDCPPIEVEQSELKNAQIKDYSYQFTGDMDSQVLVSPVVLDGKSGIMMHRLDWHKSYYRDQPGKVTGYLKPIFMAFEEDSSSALGLHYLWNEMESFYEHYSNSDDDDEPAYTGVVSCYGNS